MGRRSRKSKRRLNSSFMALLLTAIMLIISTYAWFSANREVLITGITAKVSAAEGLQISLDAENWSASVEVSQSKLSALGTSVNNYVWPTELTPVSTDGTISGTDAAFVYGDINDDGSILKAIKNAPASGGRYISFDVYLKNSSSTSGGDKLQLNTTSSVAIHTKKETEDDTYAGQAETGLENCVRAGVLLYSTKNTFTTGVSTIRSSPVGNAPLFAIWEPNYKQHIDEVVANDERITNGTSTFQTLAMLPATNGFNIKGVNGTTTTAVKVDANDAEIDGSSGTYMGAPTTLTSDAGTVTAVTDMKAVDGTSQLMLGQNSIMKARVYIWLEGQDPDCNDTASTGRAFDIAIGFTKPAPSTQNSTPTNQDPDSNEDPTQGP